MGLVAPNLEDVDPTGAGHELRRLREAWWWLLLLGILLMVGGLAAVVYPLVSSASFIIILGTILIICGVAIIITAFWTGRWSAFLVQLLAGVLYVMAGMAIRDAPLESLAVLTLLMAAFFIVAGIFRSIAALVERFPLWGWALLNGVVTSMAGIVIYDTYPFSALWVIGLLIGLELIFNGLTWLMLALAIRRLPPNQPHRQYARGFLSSSSSSPGLPQSSSGTSSGGQARAIFSSSSGSP